MSRPIVAKFGGTSMAHPERVIQRLNEAPHPIDVVVVSAAGKDEVYDEKITDLLIGYEHNRSTEALEKIRYRLSGIAARVSGNVPDVQSDVIDALRVSSMHAVPALGERWSAQLLASATGREFVDACEVIEFDDSGMLDLVGSTHALRRRLSEGGAYVLPGFYGSRPDGTIQTFDRGGSDVTGAIVAQALGAAEYQNWSDVDGFYSTNPREYSGAHPITELTYHEARELANGGSELLHREVGQYLHDTDIATRMFSTMSGESSTRVVPYRSNTNSIVVGVSGTPRLLQLTHSAFGSEEQAGTTVPLFKQLKRANIPFVHSTTSTDTLALYVDEQYHQEVSNLFPDDVVQEVGLLHIVGEGLTKPTERMRILGRLASALSEESLALRGMTDVGTAPAMTVFVESSEYERALAVAHDTLIERS